MKNKDPEFWPMNLNDDHGRYYLSPDGNKEINVLITKAATKLNGNNFVINTRLYRKSVCI